MDLINGNPGKLYRKYLGASMGGAMVSSIYSIVDMAAIGQSVGPIGAAAMAVTIILYGLCAVLPILCGIGGSVLMSAARGQGNMEEAHQWFASALVIMGVLIAAAWIVFVVWTDPLLRAFGAGTAETLAKTREYAIWMIRFFPVFVLPTFIGAFIRNDGAPNLVFGAVIVGACINIVGDWYLVFPLGMGITGAAIATVAGMTAQLALMSLHFLSKRNSLRLARPRGILRRIRKILATGLGASILNFGDVFIVLLMNNEILKHGTVTHLSVYGVVVSVASLYQAFFSGVGQAVQPLVSASFGAGKRDRMRRFWREGLVTVVLLGTSFTFLGEAFPTQVISLFVDATPELLQAAPPMLRILYIMYLFLGINVYSTYYLQSQMRDRQAMTVAVMRSILLPAILCMILPRLFGTTGLWLALPISEIATTFASTGFVRASMRGLKRQSA